MQPLKLLLVLVTLSYGALGNVLHKATLADLKERAEDADAAYGVYKVAPPETESTGKKIERDEDADAAYGVYKAPPDSSN
ncbi:MAG: hypothetical protein ALECFALPRED_009356 [Alectoria fallacina]|uniref:Uncharacterized protein n=1 Tax=Alectoria fallacina TaxID=1903189 RepID=A0A8H3PJL8_9LECA|nr:MAG: hypothetical protein ALECFALPRED_009356 [Alectoria fallacina]